MRITLIGVLLILPIGIVAQKTVDGGKLNVTPSWMKKASKSVFTLKTFAADGSLVGSSNGFYVGPDGEAVSTFTPFKGAQRAVIIDASDKEYPVVALMGANDMYDVAKFRVAATKTPALSLAPQGTAVVDHMAWVLPYRGGEKKNKGGIVQKEETFQEEYAYYTIALESDEINVGCPVLTSEGQVIGIFQPSTNSSNAVPLSYAISARFADSLKVTAINVTDPTLQLTGIRTELPRQLKDAQLMLFMGASILDSAAYVALVDEFISVYPKAADGYMARAQLRSEQNDYALAQQDMEQAIRVADDKGDAHFNYARLIYNKNVFQPEPPYESWTLDLALKEAREAGPHPTYRQLEANILFAQQKYDEAHDIYIELSQGPLRSAATFYSAARCRELQKDTTQWLALLDSTMQQFSKPYLKEAAPYLWARANARLDAQKWRAAVSDLNDYEQLMAAQVNARFYYVRHEAEVGGRLFQQALNDIDRAIQMEPTETLYYAEKASLQIRVGLYDEAIATAQECIKVDSQVSDGYLFLGLAQCAKGKTKEGIPNLQKARELGDPQADALIQRYSK